ncbi:MAG: ABC transporter ATP-binding protein [Cellulosilyticaceae bacterium]
MNRFKKNLKNIWEFDKSYIIISLFFIPLLAIQSNLSVFFSKQIIDLINKKDLNNALLFIVISLGLSIFFEVIQNYKNIYNTKTNDKYSIYTNNNFMNIITKLSVLQKEDPGFNSKYECWKLKGTKYLDNIDYYITILEKTFAFLIALFYLTKSFWVVGCISIIVAIIEGFIDYKMLPRRIEFYNNSNKMSHKQQYLYGLISNSDCQKEITILSLFQYLKNKWLKMRYEMLDYKIKNMKIEFKTTTYLLSISYLSKLIMLIILCKFVIEDRLTLGDYVAIPIAFELVVNCLTNVFFSINKIKENNTHIEDLENDIREYKQLSVTGDEIFKLDYSIYIKDLSFKYFNQQRYALKSINLTINKGEKIVILGDNGSGKSTLVKLILGLYKAPKSTILYDNIPQEKLDLESIWKKSNIVFQDFIRYMLTLKENVGFGDIEKLSNEDEIKSVLDIVGIDINNLLKGLESEVGYFNEEAINFSGGQWQRIALARALFRGKELVIFDEPTASLDPLTEIKFFDYVLTELSNKTVIIISHRVSIAAKVDKIIVMNNGAIKEVGNHEKLINKKGMYYDLWNKQQEWYQ